MSVHDKASSVRFLMVGRMTEYKLNDKSFLLDTELNYFERSFFKHFFGVKIWDELLLKGSIILPGEEHVLVYYGIKESEDYEVMMIKKL